MTNKEYLEVLKSVHEDYLEAQRLTINVFDTIKNNKDNSMHDLKHMFTEIITEIISEYEKKIDYYSDLNPSDNCNFDYDNRDLSLGDSLPF